MRNKMKNDSGERKPIEAVIIENECGRYLYELIGEEIVCDVNGGVRPAFSILAIRFAGGELSDGEFVFDVSSEYGTAKLIFERVVKGVVSPITLRDVIEDILAEADGVLIK